MTARSIQESFTLSGEWWIPGPSEVEQDQTPKESPGTLRWDERGGTLELHSALSPLRGTIYSDAGQEYPALHGTTTQSQLVSMLNGERFGSPIAIGKAGLRETEIVRSNWVVVGAHVTPQSRFSQIEARIPGLEMWLGPDGARQTISSKTEVTPAGVTFEFSGVPEDIISAPALPGIIGFGIGRQCEGNVDSHYSITTSGYLRIRPTEAQSLDWLVDRLGRAMTLLAIMAGCPMGPDQLALKAVPDESDCQLFVLLREAKTCRLDDGRRFFMNRRMLHVDAGIPFAKWFELYDRVAMPSQLALSVLYSEGLWLHVEFLSLMQALEGLHRAIMGGSYLSKDDYEPIRERLCHAIPPSVTPDHRQALKSKIQYGYEFSLRKRLDALAGRLGQELREHILGPDSSVPGIWVVTRNYYTHWDEAERVGVLDSVEMHRAGVRMKHLLRSLYLDFLGVPQPAIRAALGNQMCDESAYLIQLNNMEHRKRNRGSGRER